MRKASIKQVPYGTLQSETIWQVLQALKAATPCWLVAAPAFHNTWAYSDTFLWAFSASRCCRETCSKLQIIQCEFIVVLVRYFAQHCAQNSFFFAIVASLVNKTLQLIVQIDKSVFNFTSSWTLHVMCLCRFRHPAVVWIRRYFLHHRNRL